MSTRELEPTVRQSVLDRLVDTEPLLRGDPTTTWRESVRALREAVMRDLEWLLNTRRVHFAIPAALTELRASVFTFGLPDISSHSRDSADTVVLLQRQIEETITTFEPRLTAVQVTVRREGETKHKIRFGIEALLRMDPDPERVVFDTVLEVTSGEFQVGNVSA